MSEEFNYEQEEQLITLTMDDDTEIECIVISIFEVKGQDYIALLPVEEAMSEEDGEVFLYRYNETNGELDLQNIENDDEYESVADAFSMIIEEMESEDFDDEDEDEE